MYYSHYPRPEAVLRTLRQFDVAVSRWGTFARELVLTRKWKHCGPCFGEIFQLVIACGYIAWIDGCIVLSDASNSKAQLENTGAG